jgi:uncharacterized protein YbbK (DUF523 family)
LKPKIIVSRCLGFDSCRWNGQIIQSRAVQELKDKVNFIPVCPEVDIGLGVPRNPINLFEHSGDIKAIQSGSGLDVTDKLRSFAETFLFKHNDTKGFILKSRSPSCGYNTTKIIGRTICGDGIFTDMVRSIIKGAVIMDEKEIEKPGSKSCFLEKISL